MWGREFAVVREGFAQKQVESFVETLKAEYEARLKEKEESTAWDSFSKQILTEAEREASRIKLKAKQEAEIESSRMISEAKRDAQETMDRASRKAQDITEKQIQDILTAATKKAQLTEARARQLSQLMLIRAREDIQDHITGEVQGAYNKLNSMLEDLIGAARGIDGEWREKTLQLWSSAVLGTEEEQAELLESGNIGMLSGESVAPAPTEEPAAVLEEQTEESEAAVASQKPEVTEVSTSSQESDASSAELPIADVVQGESMEPSSTMEPSLGEYASEATAEAPAVEEATRESEQTSTILSSEPSAPASDPVIEVVADSGEGVEPTSQVEEEPQLEVPEVAEPIVPMVAHEETVDAPAPDVSGLIQVQEEEVIEQEERGGFLVPSQSESRIQIPGEEQAPETAAEENSGMGGVPPSAGLGESLQPRDMQPEKRELRDLFSGEVDLILSPPLDFTRVSELYSHLQTLPDIRVLHTAGSPWEQGTVVTVAMDRPGPLLGPLNTLSTIEAIFDLSEGTPGLLKAAMGSLGERGKRRQRISITFKRPPEPTESQYTQEAGQEYQPDA